MTVRVTNAGPEADTLHVLPTAWYRNTWAWEVDGEKPELRAAGRGARRHRASVPRPARARARRASRRCSSATTRRTRSGCSAPRRRARRRRTGSTTTSSRAPAPSRPARGRRPRSGTRLAGRAGRDGDRCASGSGRRRGGGDPWADFDAVARGPARRGRRVLRRADPGGDVGGRGARDAPGLRRDALEQAALLLRRRALARRRPDAADAAGVAARRAQRRAGGPSTPSTSCRCPTSGSTRGSPPGISPSTASRSPTSTRPSRSTS